MFWRVLLSRPERNFLSPETLDAYDVDFLAASCSLKVYEVHRKAYRGCQGHRSDVNQANDDYSRSGQKGLDHD